MGGNQNNRDVLDLLMQKGDQLERLTRLIYREQSKFLNNKFGVWKQDWEQRIHRLDVNTHSIQTIKEDIHRSFKVTFGPYFEDIFIKRFPQWPMQIRTLRHKMLGGIPHLVQQEMQKRAQTCGVEEACRHSKLLLADTFNQFCQSMYLKCGEPTLHPEQSVSEFESFLLKALILNIREHLDHQLDHHLVQWSQVKPQLWETFMQSVETQTQNIMQGRSRSFIEAFYPLKAKWQIQAQERFWHLDIQAQQNKHDIKTLWAQFQTSAQAQLSEYAVQLNQSLKNRELQQWESQKVSQVKLLKKDLAECFENWQKIDVPGPLKSQAPSLLPKIMGYVNEKVMAFERTLRLGQETDLSTAFVNFKRSLMDEIRLKLNGELAQWVHQSNAQWRYNALSHIHNFFAEYKQKIEAQVPPINWKDPTFVTHINDFFQTQKRQFVAKAQHQSQNPSTFLALWWQEFKEGQLVHLEPTLKAVIGQWHRQQSNAWHFHYPQQMKSFEKQFKQCLQLPKEQSPFTGKLPEQLHQMRTERLNALKLEWKTIEKRCQKNQLPLLEVFTNWSLHHLAQAKKAYFNARAQMFGHQNNKWQAKKNDCMETFTHQRLTLRNQYECQFWFLWDSFKKPIEAFSKKALFEVQQAMQQAQKYQLDPRVIWKNATQRYLQSYTLFFEQLYHQWLSRYCHEVVNQCERNLLMRNLLPTMAHQEQFIQFAQTFKDKIMSQRKMLLKEEDPISFLNQMKEIAFNEISTQLTQPRTPLRLS